MRKLRLLIWPVLICVLAPFLPAAEKAGDKAERQEETRARKKKERQEEREEAEAEELEAEEEFPEPPENEPLGKNIKLVFTLAPRDDDAPPKSLLCATSQYAYELNFRQGKESFHFEVSGTLKLLEKKGDVLIIFDTNMGWENDKNEGSIRAKGSAILKYGEVKALAQLGDKSLTVKASLEEEIKPRKKKQTDKDGMF